MQTFYKEFHLNASIIYRSRFFSFYMKQINELIWKKWNLLPDSTTGGELKIKKWSETMKQFSIRSFNIFYRFKGFDYDENWIGFFLRSSQLLVISFIFITNDLFEISIFISIPNYLLLRSALSFLPLLQGLLKKGEKMSNIFPWMTIPFSLSIGWLAKGIFWA